jgi:hypothetical protein
MQSGKKRQSSNTRKIATDFTDFHRLKNGKIGMKAEA